MLVNGRFVKFLFNETATTEIYTDLHTLSLPDALPIYRRAAQAALPLPDLVVLVLQGGGALGAYQAGVYEAQIELGIELDRSEEHTSELQSLMRISYAVFCLKKKKDTYLNQLTHRQQRINDKHPTIVPIPYIPYT